MNGQSKRLAATTTTRSSQNMKRRRCQPVCTSLMINALICALLSITMSGSTAAAAQAQRTPLHLQLQALPHARGNYAEQATESLAGLAAYTRNYYGLAANEAARVGGFTDLAAATYANYGAKINIDGSNEGTVDADGDVDGDSDSTTTAANYAIKPHTYNGLQHEYNTGEHGKIDFVINTANYEANVADAAAYEYATADSGTAAAPASYYYEPLLPASESQRAHDFQFAAFSNYRPAASGSSHEQQPTPPPQRQSDKQRQLMATNSFTQQPTQISYYSQPRSQRVSQPQPQEDQQLLYTQTSNHVLPPSSTTAVHHTLASSKALAGLPLAKHIEITKTLPFTQYQQLHVPYKQTVQLPVPRTIITTVPRPVPIKVPVSKTVAVPQLQDLKVPLEQIKPVAVERPQPYVVERRVPYRVEKPVATPYYYPYPIKVPIVRTVVHKQLPAHVRSTPLGQQQWP